MKKDFRVQFGNVWKHPELHFDGTYNPASEIIHLYGEMKKEDADKLINFFESYGAKCITEVVEEVYCGDVNINVNPSIKGVTLEFDTSEMDRLEID